MVILYSVKARHEEEHRDRRIIEAVERDTWEKFYLLLQEIDF